MEEGDSSMDQAKLRSLATRILEYIKTEVSCNKKREREKARESKRASKRTAAKMIDGSEYLER